MAQNLQQLKRRIPATLGAQFDYSLLTRDSRYSSFVGKLIGLNCVQERI